MESIKKVMKTAADTLKRVHLELGGKAPHMVFADADVASFAQKATLAVTFNTGQDCTAATRVYVEQSRYNGVKEAVVESMRAVKIGPQFADNVEMGPLFTKDVGRAMRLSADHRLPYLRHRGNKYNSGD